MYFLFERWLWRREVGVPTCLKRDDGKIAAYAKEGKQRGARWSKVSRYRLRRAALNMKFHRMIKFHNLSSNISNMTCSRHDDAILIFCKLWELLMHLRRPTFHIPTRHLAIDHVAVDHWNHWQRSCVCLRACRPEEEVDAMRYIDIDSCLRVWFV